VIFRLLDYVNLAGFLNSHGRYGEALRACEAGLRLQPEEPLLHASLGRAALGLECEQEALEACSRALELDPACIEAYVVRAYALEALGRHADAVAAARAAVALAPGAEDAHCTLASLLLWHGDLAEGLVEQEWHWRREAETLAARLAGIPPWDGAPSSRPRLLVASEQGAGDLLQIVRFMPAVRERVASVRLEAPIEIADLMQSAAGIDEVVTKGAPPDGGIDAYVRLMSVPRILGTTIGTLPAPRAYLAPDQSRAAKWRERIGDDPFKIGIAWAGNPAHTNDRERSIELAAFERLAAVPGIRWFSLQKGAREGDPAPFGLVRPALDDFAETAAVIANLDLVIAVDTAVAHLAGALGKPVWLLLPRWPDWRWMLEGGETPWYPSMRLFRRARGSGWGEVFESVAGELRSLVGG
jgi:tetratricopeptide (TPR) repeat protein